MTTETHANIVNQEWIEEHYNRKHIDAKIKAEIQASTLMQGKVQQGVELVTEWLQEAKQSYESKARRAAQLEMMDLTALVMDIFIGIAYIQRYELFTSVTAQMAARLKLSDKTEAITAVAELLAVLCNTDVFDIHKQSKMASLMVISRIPLSDELIEFIEGSQYLPPMVCEPLELTHNYSSGYLTHNDSLILGQGNHHDGDLCLDVLNTMNRVALKLDLEFLCNVEEDPSDVTVDSIKEKALKKGKFLTDADAKERVRVALENWDSFKRQSYRFYSLMQRQGNRFYLTHKVDKRGRGYSQGYHINTQGSPFKKAMLEFADEEVVEGVPT